MLHCSTNAVFSLAVVPAILNMANHGQEFGALKQEQVYGVLHEAHGNALNDQSSSERLEQSAEMLGKPVRGVPSESEESDVDPIVIHLKAMIAEIQAAKEQLVQKKPLERYLNCVGREKERENAEQEPPKVCHHMCCNIRN